MKSFMKNIENCSIATHVFILSLIIFLFMCTFAGAEENALHYSIPRVESSPDIDGEIGDGEWKEALKAALNNETQPSQNIPAIVDTEVFMMEDGVNFYIAFMAFDPEPEKIRAFFRDRDSGRDDDSVGIVIDTFNDERRAFNFFANALGVQSDGTRDDVAGWDDWSWNAIWDSAGKIHDSGYTVEMEIPLDQLRYPEGKDIQTWGIDLVRNYPRDKRHSFSNRTEDFDVTCYLCQLKKAEGFSNLKQPLNLRIVPAVTASYSEIRPDPKPNEWESDFKLDAGIDVRWGINQNLYLNATVNPDFSQVEADSAQIDINSTYSLFFPEKREFFLEGADYFSSHMDTVYSRNISSPDFGVKLTGKHDIHSFGMFFTNDDTTNFIIPGNQGSFVAGLEDEKSLNTAFRYRRDISDNINIGTVFTDRRADDYANTVAGIDGNMRIGSSNSVTAQFMKSYSKYPDIIQKNYGQNAKIDDLAYLIDYSHNDNHWSWRASHVKYGADFRADMGFINRVGYRKTDISGGHTWHFGPDRPFSRINIFGDWEQAHDEDGNRLENFYNISISADGPMQSFIVLGYNKGERFYNSRNFNEYSLSYFMRIKPTTNLDISLDINYGDKIDYVNTRLGKRLSISPWVIMHIGKHFQTNLRHSFERMEVDGKKLYSTNLSDLRFTYQFNLKSFLRTTFQYSYTKCNRSLYFVKMDSRSKNLTTQILYSYKLNPLTRFFIGYSDTGFQNDGMDKIRQTGRVLFSKFSYTF